MKSFEKNFYTNDYDQEMLDFIEGNYSVDKINGWYNTVTLNYHHTDNDFYVSSNGISCDELLTKEQFKEKIGMTSNTSDKSVFVFTKDMLKDGMFVKVDGVIYAVLGKVLCSYEMYILLEDYDESLNDKREERWDIQEVCVLEGEDNIAPLSYFLSGNGLTTIWKRPPEKTPVQKAIEERIAATRKHLLELEKLLEENS